MQLVRDDDNGLSVRLHGAHDGKEFFRLLRRKHCRRLVKNEDIRPAVKDLDNLHSLLFGDRHIVDLLFGVEFKSVSFGNFLNFVIDAPYAVLIPAGAEHDVLRCGENVNQLKVLVHHADMMAESVLRRRNDRLLTVDKDLPFVRIVNARDHVHQRRLSAAVFTQKCQDLPLLQRKVDVPVRHDRAETLADVS